MRRTESACLCLAGLATLLLLALAGCAVAFAVTKDARAARAGLRAAGALLGVSALLLCAYVALVLQDYAVAGRKRNYQV